MVINNWRRLLVHCGNHFGRFLFYVAHWAATVFQKFRQIFDFSISIVPRISIFVFRSKFQANSKFGEIFEISFDFLNISAKFTSLGASHQLWRHLWWWQWCRLWEWPGWRWGGWGRLWICKRTKDRFQEAKGAAVVVELCSHDNKNVAAHFVWWNWLMTWFGGKNY